MTVCAFCGVEIYFDKHHKTEGGKFIPMDRETSLPHDCQKKPVQREPQIVKCRNCGGEIYFDDKKLSSTGKKIPIDYETDEPHNCTGEARDKERAWQEDKDRYWRPRKP